MDIIYRESPTPSARAQYKSEAENKTTRASSNIHVQPIKINSLVSSQEKHWCVEIPAEKMPCTKNCIKTREHDDNTSKEINSQLKIKETC
jgi:hypothetical protein